MLCDICHKNKATVHLTEINNGKVVEVHICAKCAQAKAEEIKVNLSLGEFLGKPKNMGEKTTGKIQCDFCGMTLEELRKVGRVGCYKCYDVFKEFLEPLIRKIHGDVQHIGKIPFTVSKESLIERKIKMLKMRLERAIKLEEYEEAGRIRDMIRELEGKKSNDKKSSYGSK